MEMKNHLFLKAIKSGESEDVALREAFSPDFPRLMSAFSNTRGGMIIVGVNSQKKIIGVKGDLDQLQQSISGSAQTIYPPLVPDVQVHEVRGKKVVVVVIQKVPDNAFNTFRGAIYARVGGSVRKFEAVQLEDFLKRRRFKDFGESAHYELEIQNLDQVNEREKRESLDQELPEPAVDYNLEAQALDGLNERQKKGIQFLRKHKAIKMGKYEKLNKVSSGTARADIHKLIKLGYVKKTGSHRKIHYVLNKEKVS